MGNYSILFAVTGGPAGLWCQMASQKTMSVCPEAGECADLLLRAYRTFRQMEFPADPEAVQTRLGEALGQIVPWYYGCDPSPVYRAITLEELAAEAARDKVRLICRYDLRTGDFSVSAGPDLLHTALAIPGRMDRKLAEHALASAKAIGFALGTKRPAWTRKFKEPWQAVARCLAGPDPETALRMAAGGDALSRRAWIETAEESVRCGLDLPNETLRTLTVKGKEAWSLGPTENLDRMAQVVGVRIGEASGPDTISAVLRFLERDGAWYLCLPRDHCYFHETGNVLSNQALQLKTPYGGRAGLARMLTSLDGRDGADGLRRLRTLAAALALADEVHTWGRHDRRDIRLLAWYALDMLRDCPDEETILPEEMCELTWGELLLWLHKAFSHCRFWQDRESLFGTPGPRDGEDLLLLRDSAAEALSYDRLREELNQTLRDGLAAQNEDGWTGILNGERWLGLNANLAGLGQHIYVADPLDGGPIKEAVLAYDGTRFCAAFEDGASEPIQDILDRGGRLATTRREIGPRVAELGRQQVLYEVAADNQRVTFPDDVEEKLSRQLSILTVPAGWVYTFVRFRDGKFGIAYGPLRDGEPWAEGTERLLSEAESMPSESALFLLP